MKYCSLICRISGKRNSEPVSKSRMRSNRFSSTLKSMDLMYNGFFKANRKLKEFFLVDTRELLIDGYGRVQFII